MQENQAVNAELVSQNENESWLNETEAEELAKFRAIYQKGGSPTYSLSAKVQQGLFCLYLNGKPLSEIANLNSGQCTFGQVVHAAVEGDWHKHRQVYLQDLLGNVRTRVQQVAAEGANFIADSLSAAHKEHGLALKRYLQTGDKAQLGEFAITNAGQYANAINMLLKLTGADNNKNINITGNINHTANEPASGATSVTLAGLAAAKKALEGQKK
jgi:hypothetical protein